MFQQAKQSTHPSFFVLILVSFFWGFVAASNSIFIPFCKAHFHLNQLESQLTGFLFYGAYFIGSLLLYTFSAIRGVDILNKIGYQKGIIYGLLLFPDPHDTRWFTSATSSGQPGRSVFYRKPLFIYYSSVVLLHTWHSSHSELKIF